MGPDMTTPSCRYTEVETYRDVIVYREAYTFRDGWEVSVRHRYSCKITAEGPPLRAESPEEIRLQIDDALKPVD